MLLYPMLVLATMYLLAQPYGSVGSTVWLYTTPLLLTHALQSIIMFVLYLFLLSSCTTYIHTWCVYMLHTHARTRARMHTRTHARTHACTYAHTHTHTCFSSYSSRDSQLHPIHHLLLPPSISLPCSYWPRGPPIRMVLRRRTSAVTDRYEQIDHSACI